MFLEVSLASPDGRGKARDKGHCWSDAGYREIEFRFEARASGDTWDPTKPLYLHLDCDGWRADLMEADGQQDDDDFDRSAAAAPKRLRERLFFFGRLSAEEPRPSHGVDPSSTDYPRPSPPRTYPRRSAATLPLDGYRATSRAVVPGTERAATRPRSR